MTYLASARAQETWIKLGGFTSVNRSVPMATYVDPVARTVAEELTEAKVSRFSAGDVMPTSLQRGLVGGDAGARPRSEQAGLDPRQADCHRQDRPIGPPGGGSRGRRFGTERWWHLSDVSLVSWVGRVSVQFASVDRRPSL
jgi:hypothetical protein